ncbi:hypothetical protein [Deinococcus alpinitundrae]|uniref:hypothetical protein n=1 Tax=Deinococcus alpinitundrae TaxID=468913 RepID=UPI00137B111D|nr:hypothetical protein [Deinococcus alpinitundrae]
MEKLFKILLFLSIPTFIISSLVALFSCSSYWQGSADMANEIACNVSLAGVGISVIIFLVSLMAVIDNLFTKGPP